MTKTVRTIEELRNRFEGKVYVKFSNADVFNRFLQDAEAEGYMIRDRKPTEADASYDIKAVEYDKRISNCGIISHIACQAGGDNIHVIDFEKYVNGECGFEGSRL